MLFNNNFFGYGLILNPIKFSPFVSFNDIQGEEPPISSSFMITETNGNRMITENGNPMITE